MNTTLIGSMPYTDPEIAVEKILNSVNIPCWPQLPKRSFKEQMCPQYAEQFPGIVIDENNEKVYVDEEKLFTEIDVFYQNYIDKNIDHFALSEEFAIGFHKFLTYVNNIKKLKVHTTGPLTFGLTVKTSSGNAIYYNEQYRDVVIKHLVMKSLYQIKKIVEFGAKNVDTVILFYDEPYLAAYGSAFTAVSKDEIIITLNELAKETKNLVRETCGDKIQLMVGVHCCANTDWSILTSVDNLDIISFDAYEYFDNFLLYPNEINKFLVAGGTIAWGIIPNTDKVFNENFHSINKKLQHQIDLLRNKDIKINFNNTIVTPQCGLGNTTTEIVDYVLKICSQLTQL